MTRETKIGLLVGLAFIIVIGILLSDHMTSTTEPPKAPLSAAGENVRQAVMTPASQGGQAAGTVAAAAVGPGAGTVTPGQPVYTREELAAAAAQQQQQLQQQQAAQQRPPVTIQVGPGPASHAQPPVITQGPVQPPPNVVTPAAPAPDAPVAIAPTGRQQPNLHPLQRVASRHGEELVTFGADGATQQPPTQSGVPMTPLREYKAQAGDSLSKIALRFMGSAGKANRDAIVRANPSLHQNPDRIIEGRTYLIPPPPAVEAQPTTTTPQVVNAAQPAATNEAQAAAGSQGFAWYTVKENDNLWKIAAEQCGTGNAWAELKELNRDILKGGEMVRPNMRIRIPSRPVASTAD